MMMSTFFSIVFLAEAIFTLLDLLLLPSVSPTIAAAKGLTVPDFFPPPRCGGVAAGGRWWWWRVKFGGMGEGGSRELTLKEMDSARPANQRGGRDHMTVM